MTSWEMNCRAQEEHNALISSCWDVLARCNTELLTRVCTARCGCSHTLQSASKGRARLTLYCSQMRCCLQTP